MSKIDCKYFYTETGSLVFDCFCKKHGKKFNTFNNQLRPNCFFCEFYKRKKVRNDNRS